MATLFLICGLPGAGKTTLARRLEKTHNALRLCPDEWIAQILLDPNDRAEMDRLRAHVESIQWKVAERTLVLGINVILENGFWSHEERHQLRREAETIGADVELHYLDVNIDELWRRLSKRNANLPPGTFRVSKDELEQWAKSFEPPREDEFDF
ncbi:MAG: AAA family ATPase, partial [Anaerolineales bacterium]|nr:AAA family ATPase [Anaerolineales bacterium]